VSSFHLAMGIEAGLMIIGGLIAAVGIRNPERAVEHDVRVGAATAGECGRCPKDPAGHGIGVGEEPRDAPQPAPA
jgi:hypothetical protein